MPFQEDAQSWRAKAHLSDVKPAVLIGICALVICALFFAISGLWSAFTHESFSIETEEAPALSPDNENESAERESSGAQRVLFLVHVGGAVINPGVYELEEGSRIQHAIDAAGGFNEAAARDAINLARTINDGEQIIVPTLEQLASPPAPNTPETGVLQGSQKININTASAAELTALSGVGEATAQKIVTDREKNGPFSSPEDLKRVSGIGEKKYVQIADSICV